MYGGALLDDEGKQIGSMLIIDVADKAEADAFADADPFVEAGSVRQHVGPPVSPGLQGRRLARWRSG